MPVPRRWPRRARSQVAPRQGVAVEAVLGHELHGDAQHAVGAEAPVFLQDEGGLEVVVEGDDPRPVRAEVVGRRLPLEVNQDALDDVAVLDRAERVDGLGDHVLVDPPALQDAHHDVFADAAGEQVGVERVHVRVGLGVVAEERLVDAHAPSPPSLLSVSTARARSSAGSL